MPTVRTGSSYTLALADNHRLVECANAAAITVTVPTDAAVAFPLGARIEIVQVGAGQITVGGAGITLRLPAGKAAKTRMQYAIIVLTKRNSDEWILSVSEALTARCVGSEVSDDGACWSGGARGSFAK